MQFEKPTLDDFKSWMQEHLDAAITDIQQSVSEIERRNNAAGRYRSGSTVVQVYEAALRDFSRGIDKALGELKRALRITDVNPSILRRENETLLLKFTEQAKEATKPHKLWEFAGPKLVKEKLAEFDRKLQFSLRQFAVGFLDPDEPVARPLATHNIHVQSMVGGAIQQGTTGSTQNVSTTINLGDVRAAFAQLNDALKSAELPTPADSEMRADLDTIKAQLNKEAPSTTILQEAGRSLRTISEGLAANVLALPSAAGLEALLKALGVL